MVTKHPPLLRPLLTLPCLLLIFLSACGINPQINYERMRGYLATRRYDEAVTYIDTRKNDFYGNNNLLLYYLDKLMALHSAKRYQESNKLVDRAAKLIEDLFTKSVSQEVGAVLTSDNALSYEGEDFEKAFIYVIGALNYLYLGEHDEALVDARRVELVLDKFNRKYREENQNNPLNTYSEDAFIRWFSGYLYGWDQNGQALNDALISFRRALNTYESVYTPKYGTRAPRILIEDYLRAAHYLHFEEDLTELRQKYGNVDFISQSQANTMGEILFMHLNGEAPFKVDRFWSVPFDNKIVQVAYPEFIRKHKRIAYAVLRIGNAEATTEVVEDIEAIAIQNLHDRMGRIQGKMIARALAKYAIAKGTEAGVAAGTKDNGAGAFAGLLVSIIGAATEQADKRSWLLLPASVDVARVFVPPGVYNGRVDFYASNGRLIESTAFNRLTVKPRSKLFLSHRSI